MLILDRKIVKKLLIIRCKKIILDIILEKKSL